VEQLSDNTNSSQPMDVPHLGRSQFLLGTDADAPTRKLDDNVQVEDSGCYGDSSFQARNSLSYTQSFPISNALDQERKGELTGGELTSRGSSQKGCEQPS